MKRLIDIILAIICLILAAPIMLLVSILNLIFLKRPIFFLQKRVGYKCKEFYLIKFRSMVDTTDGSGELLPDPERLPRYGEILRKYSLDELPNLINVLKGEMSLVGPRPLLKEELRYYTKEQMTRHEVKPGITGLAQVNGRNSITWDEKLSFDVKYVQNASLWLDLKIMVVTVFKVIRGVDVPQKQYATMPRYNKRS